MAIRKAQVYKQRGDAIAARDLFISMAAHELRTPVTTMYVYTQLLKRKANRGEKFDLEWINTLLYEMARLTKLIDELLQINQIKSGNFKYEFEEINLENVIKNSLKTFRASHKKALVNYRNKMKKDIKLIGDPNKLEQVIINLLDNAAKHNEWGKPIKLTLDKKDHTARFSVEDEGTGISREDLEHVFDEFYKGTGHTKAGMGLGLFLIKKIIDEHKGKIKLTSQLGNGTIVTIDLPLIKYN
jgi:signal transduction histidine kinase